MKRAILGTLAALLAISCATVRETAADYVNPFIGTDAHGHTYPGATTPFGMVQLSPDTGTEGWDWCSGYHSSDSSIIGFSHTHLSGTGGADLGDILFMPSAGEILLTAGTKENPDSGYRSRFSHSTERASAGYYGVTLDDNNIGVELSATPRTGLHRYIFSKESKFPHVIIDLNHGIQDRLNSAYLNQVDDRTVEGWRRSNGWADDHTVFFRAEFSQPIAALTFRDSVGVAIFEQGVDTLQIQVAISTVSLDGAAKNLEAERVTFAEGHSKARDMWNSELGKIKVEGGSEADKEIFYTALYHSLTAPTVTSDVDGSYRGSNKQLYNDTTATNYGLFSLWDTFRALHPLLAIVQPEKNAEFVQSMVRYYTQSGRLPVWDLNMCENNCMIGYHSIPVIASAYLKGTLPADFDAELALQAMVASANSETYAGLPYYRQFKYLPLDKENNSVSKALEYAYDDWCIAQMARAMGKTDIYNEFIARAQYYKNHFDPADGFMKGRDSKGGRTANFDPTALSILGQGDYTEGNSWQYSFFVPQDVNGHIELLGGDSLYIDKLEKMFSDTSALKGHAVDVTGLIGQYAHGNEPSHHVAYLYAYAGAPWMTQQRIAQIKAEMYHTGRDGLSGNEDCGQMSAWYVLSALGFYEVTPASGIYVLGTPTFEKTQIGDFTIEAKNLSKKNIYIDKIDWNGTPYTKSYITDEMVRGGGNLVLYMTSTPNKTFGAAPADRPIQAITDNVMSAAQMLSQITFEPMLGTAQRVFEGSMEIIPTTANADATILYSLNGAAPTVKLTDKIVIDKSCVLNIAATDNATGRMSTVGKYKFFNGKLPSGVKISGTEPNEPYIGGGLAALGDGLTGGENYQNAHWAGFRGEGAKEIVIELPQPQKLTQIGVDFYNAPGAWIMLPASSSVSFSDSAKGTKFGTQKFNITDSRTVAEGSHYFTATAPTVAVKFIYITMVGQNLPVWHNSKGNPAWIFVDEITAR